MTVTTEQLKSLADLLNERRAEWNFSLNPLSLGEVRSIYDAYGEWWQALAKQKASDSWDSYQEGYASGLYDAEEAARDKAAEAEPPNDDEREMDSIDEVSGIADDDWCGDDGEPADEQDSPEYVARVEGMLREWQAADDRDIAAGKVPPDVAAILGPEHHLNTPLRPYGDYPPGDNPDGQVRPVSQVRPIGRDRLPDPDVARTSIANMLANGSGGQLESLATRKPRTLAEADELAAELAAVIVALRAMATDGEMPPILVWDGERPPELPRWAMIQRRYGVTSWATMAAMAELSAGTTRKQATANEPAERIKPRPKAGGLPTRQELIAELRRQSMGGVMPSQSQFNDAKPANWSAATSQCTRFDTSWDELAKEAGLKPRQRGPVSQAQAA